MPPAERPEPASESPPQSGLSTLRPGAGFWGRLLGTADRANLPLLASAVTFDAILAIVPLAVLVVGGLGLLLDRTGYFGTADPMAMIARLFPLAGGDGNGSASTAELMRGLLERIRISGGQFTIYATPAFLWFSTRLFGSLRTALSRIFELQTPPHHRGVVIGYLIGYLRGKLKDFITVGVVFLLALISTILTASLSLLDEAGSWLPPPWTMLLSGLGQMAGQGLAFGSGLLLFTLLYRYATPRRMPWRDTLLAGGLAAAAFELAKFLFGLYVGRMGGSLLFSIGANIGAVLLLILWIWYTAMVFLIGAAVAHTIESRDSGGARR